MRLLVTSDWHVCLRNLEPCRMVVEQLLGLTDSNTWVLHCGDILGDRGPACLVDQRAYNFLIESVTALREKSAGFLFVRGNHDMIATPDGVPSCVPLMRKLGVDWIADAAWTRYVNARRGLWVWIWMVPYFRDPARQKAAFGEAWRDARRAKVPCKILAFHNEVAGCSYGGRTSTGLTAADIGAAEYDVCVGGHVHRPQLLQPNVHFVGSPFAMDWGECNELKRHLIIEV